MANKRTLTDAEFERQYQDAMGKAEESVALSAEYRTDLGLVWIELSNGCVFGFPPHVVEALADASEDTIREVELLGGGCGLHWESLDLDLSVTGLLIGSFGTRAWMQEIGRKGGRSTSNAKAAAARANGRKGGRPPSKPAREDEGHPDADLDAAPSGVLWDSPEAGYGEAHSVSATVVADEQGATTPSSWRTPGASRTPRAA